MKYDENCRIGYSTVKMFTHFAARAKTYNQLLQVPGWALNYNPQSSFPYMVEYTVVPKSSNKNYNMECSTLSIIGSCTLGINFKFSIPRTRNIKNELMTSNASAAHCSRLIFHQISIPTLFSKSYRPE